MVKLEALVTLQPIVVTLTLPVVAPGITIATNCDPVLETGIAAIPPIVIVVGLLRLVPVIVISVPTGPLEGLKEFIIGALFNVPLAVIFCVVAPVDAQAILPEGVPVAVAVILTYIVVVLTVPPDGANRTLAAKPVPDTSDTSKPAGAVTVKLPVKLVPETVNVCSAEAVPAQAVNGVNVPLTTMLLPPPVNTQFIQLKLHVSLLVESIRIVCAPVVSDTLFKATVCQTSQPPVLGILIVPRTVAPNFI